MKTHFTSREKQILQLIARAVLRKNIAKQLQISIHTVDAHLQSIHKKTNTTTMVELLLFITAHEASLGIVINN